MFKENAEPVMWWRIEGRHYIEFDDCRKDSITKSKHY
jgi:hypothetical protein